MTEYYFEEQMSRMRSLFGEKSYPKERLNSIWRTCAVLPNESFKFIVDRFVDSARTAPLPEEFKKLAYEEKKRLGIEYKEPETLPSKEADCWDCGDSGNLFIFRKETFEPWAKWGDGVIRCHCKVGRARPISQGPIWNSQWETSYSKDPVYYIELQKGFRPNKEVSAWKVANVFRSTKKKSGSEELESFEDVLSPDPNDAA